jgi:superfamily II DNA or RNA helicase
MRIKPREEQRNVTKQVFSLLEKNPSALVVAPTGYGKTVVMGDVAHEEIQRGGRVLVIVNLQVLLGQTVATMEHGFGVETSALHDKIESYLVGAESHPLVCDYKRNLLVTLPKTMTNTLDINVTNDLYFDPSFVPTMILFDEAHKATAAEFQKIRKNWPNAKVVGFTATPYREKNDPGESLEEWYGDRIVIAATMSELIARGDLARPRYFETPGAHVAKTWLLATAGHSNKRTIVFTDDTNHSKMLEAQFLGEGIKCEVVTAGKGVVGDVDYVPRQAAKVREEIFARFHRGETEVLISVDALCEGFDEKLAKFCFLTRKVGNIAFYQQMCGRVLRKCEGKPEGFIYDFEGNLKEHGYVEAIEWPRAAKGLVLEGEDREISAKTYAKQDNVWTRCSDPCGHVYNIKQNSTCPLCRKGHGVMVNATISTMVFEWFGMGAKEFEVMAPKIRMAIDNPSLHAMVNRQTGKQIFQDGQINVLYSILPDVLAVYETSKKRVGNKYVGNWEGQVSYAA